LSRVSIILIVIFVTGGLMWPATPATAAGRTWTVTAGGATKDFGVSANAFYPHKIEVAVGDRVLWKFAGFHNVAFLGGAPLPPLTVQESDRTYFNPKVFFRVGGKTYDGAGYRGSGTPPEDPAAFARLRYALTFTSPGTYHYVCGVHGPGMGGTVIVKDRASGSPAAADAQRTREQAATIKAGQAAWAAWKTERSGNTVIVPLIGDLATGYSILRFSREPLVVSRGTTITWVMRNPFEIHTVTFTSGQRPPEFAIPQPQAQGPPKLLVNPKVAAPTPHRNYLGTGYVNSGILFPAGMPGNLPTSYSLTFSKPGRYEYWCVIHAPEGMKGVVIVK